MTQGEVAERAGVTRYWVTNLELGKGNPTFSSLSAVLHAVGLRLRATPASDAATEHGVRQLEPPVDLDVVLARTRRS